jgi:hypothetical protein
METMWAAERSGSSEALDLLETRVGSAEGPTARPTLL